MTTSTPPKRSNYILFVGNPGVGKSTLLNGLLGEAKFLSGASYGSGLTQALQLCEHEGICYGDTPGLEDSKMKQQAAREIKNALTQDGRYRIVFVCTTEGGRIRGPDLATISCVLKAIQKESIPYGIVYNKIENRHYRELQQSSDEYVQLKLRCETEGDGAGALTKALQGVSDADMYSSTYKSVSTFTRVLADVNSMPAYPTDHIFFYKRDGDIAGEDNVVPKLQDGFRQWVVALPAIDVKPEEVCDLAVDELQAVKAAHEAALVELHKTKAKVEELPAMQRRLKQMQASLDALHRSHRSSKVRTEPPASPVEGLMRDMSVSQSASQSVSKSCSDCGESGHNRTTCTYASSHNTEAARSPQSCSDCGGTGHNRRTCNAKRKGGSRQRCGNCGGVGHNRRMCGR